MARYDECDVILVENFDMFSLTVLFMAVYYMECKLGIVSGVGSQKDIEFFYIN